MQCEERWHQVQSIEEGIRSEESRRETGTVDRRDIICRQNKVSNESEGENYVNSGIHYKVKREKSESVRHREDLRARSPQVPKKENREK